jgi:hypothetical protein
MKKWTKAERAEASRKAKERVAAKKRTFNLVPTKREGGMWTETQTTPSDELQVLAMQLGKERAWRSSVAAQLISMANELLQMP